MKKSTIIGVVVVAVVIIAIFLATKSNNVYAPQVGQPEVSAPVKPSASVSQSVVPKQSAPAPKGVTVSISNFSFTTNNINVAKGTTVTWVNHDSMTHTVTAPPGGPSSRNLGTGASYSFTFNTVGTFNYHCAIHPGMTGTVVVQ